MVENYTLSFALGVGIFATGVLFAVRFVGVVIGARDIGEKDQKEKLRGWVILTLSGVKGTVSLATAFSLPLVLADGESFTQRDFLLFVTACVIILSLIISTVFLPLIAKPKRTKRRDNIYANIIRDTIPEIESSCDVCAQSVAIQLRQRARQLEYEELGAEQKREVSVIRKEFSEREFSLLMEQRDSGEITADEYEDCRRILTLINMIQNGSTVRQLFNRLLFALKLLDSPAGKDEKIGARGKLTDYDRIHALFWANTGKVGTLLENKYGRDDKFILSRVIERRIDVATMVMERYYGALAGRALGEEYDRLIKRGFDLERRKLDEYLAGGRVNEDEADEIRIQINNLETYAIRDVQSDLRRRGSVTSRIGAGRS
jgi:CPA1 family monovalent cation:H+ antiporter